MTRTPVAVFSLIAACLIAALTLGGCKSAPVPAPVKVIPVEKPLLLDGMTDEQMVHANQQDGLGLGLRIAGLDGNRFPAGAPVPIHIAMEDLGAREPIASGMCSGFSLMATDVATQNSETNQITVPHCFATVPYPDEVPFAKGKLKAVDITQRNASNMTLLPGTYLLRIVWRAIPAGKATIVERTAYTTMKSNAVQVTVVK